MEGHAMGMQPISEAHQRLGRALRRVREANGATNRKVPKPGTGKPYFSSGYISQVEAGTVTSSTDLIDGYIALGGDHAELRALYAQVQAAVQESGRTRRRGGDAAPEQPPQRIEDVIVHEDVQRHYVTESDDASYAFTGGGTIETVEHIVTIRAKVPNVRLYYAGHRYGADRQPGVLRVDAISGATLAESQESDTGVLRSYFALDRTLSPDDLEPYQLAFRLTVNSTAQALPRLTFHNGAGLHRMVLRAQFRAPMLPKRIWWCSAPDTIDADAEQDGHELTADAGHVYRHPFDDLVPGWVYGFAWVW
jgi:hypothetical protein